jgi:hypothetical protein
MEDHWDTWLGMLALEGVDPRTWDLQQLLAAWEVQLQRGAKDEADWRNIRMQLYAPPRPVQRAQRPVQRPAATAPATGATAPAQRQRTGPGIAASEADALLARFALADAMFNR